MKTLTLLFALVFPLSAIAAVDKLSADEILQKNFFASKVSTLEKNVTLTLTDNQGNKRERKIYALSALLPNGIDSRLIVRITEPADVRGIGFLKHEHLDSEDDQWIYLPAMHKSRRLVANNKKDSFMGSDFSYGDILTPKVSLYHNKLLDSETIDGIECYVIESIPINDQVKRDYDYGKKVQWIAKSNFYEVKIDYYDLAGKHLKTQLIKGTTLMDKDMDRWAATSREMINYQTEHKSIFVATSAKAGINVPDATFTLRNLERE